LAPVGNRDALPHRPAAPSPPGTRAAAVWLGTHRTAHSARIERGVMTAAHDWLDLRVPYDDAARQHSLSLLNQLGPALRSPTVGQLQPVAVIDIGAGTGNSACWFRQHLPDLLPGLSLRWVLIDTDQAALDTAVATLP